MSLAVAYPVRGVGLSLFIAISSLVLTAVALSLNASNLEQKFASLSFLHTITGNDSDSLRWGHIVSSYIFVTNASELRLVHEVDAFSPLSQSGS